MADDDVRELAEAKARISELEALLRKTGSTCIPKVRRRSASAGLQTVRLVHRWAGSIVSVFLLVMGISGIFLTHAYYLGLQPLMVQVHTGLFLDWAARIYCDTLGVTLAALVITGLYMHVSLLRQRRSRGGK